MIRYRLWIVLCPLFTVHTIMAQSQPGQNGDTIAKIDLELVSSFIKDIDRKIDRILAKMDNHEAKILKKAKRHDLRVKKKLEKKDSVKAAEFFRGSDYLSTQLDQRSKDANSVEYIPSVDTLRTSIKYLQQNPDIVLAGELQHNLKQSLRKIDGLSRRFAKAEEIRKYLVRNKEQLRRLGETGFAKDLQKLNKQTFYYIARLNEYKSLLKDHRKAERTMIELLTNTRLFQNFMRKNSQLASLFRLPGDPNDPVGAASIAGLQTRAQVNNLIQQQIAANGAAGQQQFQQNMLEAKDKLNQLREKLNAGEFIGNMGDEMPGVKKVNGQRTKSFWKKWELGINIQNARATGILPVTSDLGISAGFKANDKLTAGVGLAGRIGWGRNIHHISISYQGISARSFSELKLKGSFHATAGFELNYRNEFQKIDELRNYSAWQKSGLLGLSKIVSLKTKFFKKTKLQLLWDFLSYRQVPLTQPVIFRIEYSL